jgi:hypothetical protein
MNSTTVDPGWNGRQVFLLVNAAWHDVEIKINEHFCTMVLQDVKQRSALAPNDTRSVLARYVQLYQGDTSNAFTYVLNKDDDFRTFNNKVDSVRATTERGELWVRIQLMVWFVLRHKWRFAYNLLILVLLGAPLAIKRFELDLVPGVSDKTLARLGDVGNLIGGILAVIQIVLLVISTTTRPRS